MKTIADLYIAADQTQTAVIGTEPELFTLSYRELSDQVTSLATQLAASGLAPGARVGIVLPNGPEFIVTFLAVTNARLTAAPFNPALTEAELETLFTDGQVRALIATREMTAANAAAARLALPIWPVTHGAAGRMEIDSPRRGHAVRPEPEPDDVALFLHTSGTTSRPKGVPLTHANITSSIANIAESFALGPGDCSLLAMPLFHVHGLIGATLATLHAGGRVVAPPRFSAGNFWPLVSAQRVTWYSAVPTIHRTLLLRAASDAPRSSGLRFIRSCSSALAPAVMHEMEERFQAPVLEAYGMTEASHQIASNPPPPAIHHAGSVGRGGRVEVAIMDDRGTILPPGESAGEVVVRGPNVMGGYYNNPDANAAAFVNGWLRTGDRGTVDQAGYVRLIGRLKELINRGGEKISPLEIDGILLAHPAVAEAASFGAPDRKYGEEVAAAVVLKGTATAADLQEYCRGHLADFKVPKTFYFVAELPKTATGKVQRNGLAARLVKN